MACVSDDTRETYIMLEQFFMGFGLGFSLILAIGAQNAFVLKAGLMRRFVLPIVLFCAASDSLLIFLGVLGLGTLLEALPNLMSWMRFAGALFLFVYGVRSIISAWRGNQALNAIGDLMSLPAALFTCLVLTFLNPHVYLDTVILVGGIANQSESPWGFGLGAMLASFTFFFGLGYSARLLAPFFANPRAWQILDMGIAFVMWAIAYTLFASH